MKHTKIHFLIRDERHKIKQIVLYGTFMNNIRRLFHIDSIHKKGISGNNISVAVMDTGAYPHADFGDRIISFKDCMSSRCTPYDDNSHGTHVCGIIGGSGKMSRGLYKGIAPQCLLIPIKVLKSDGIGNSSGMIDGVSWILENRTKYNIRIVNISIGTETFSCDDEQSALVMAVDKMWDAGITVITSAGNNGPEYHTITTPGISRKVITVGASAAMGHTDTSGKNHTTYSGKGPTFCDIPKPDITAPGSHIISCHSYRNGYTSKSGTSMSTPIVSGAAALVFSYNPGITNNQFKELLCRSARDIGLDRYTQGCGELDLQRLLSLC